MVFVRVLSCGRGNPQPDLSKPRSTRLWIWGCGVIAGSTIRQARTRLTIPGEPLHCPPLLPSCRSCTLPLFLPPESATRGAFQSPPARTFQAADMPAPEDSDDELPEHTIRRRGRWTPDEVGCCCIRVRPFVGAPPRVAHPRHHEETHLILFCFLLHPFLRPRRTSA